ncbi:LysR family transcriptional regulator [Bartonella sp. DGB2]|uniref:LysR family transcriptional regulator n=1 Tax=Bartonella sp. DGB2 TaxID=3388426 RepID=UPI00398FEB71
MIIRILRGKDIYAYLLLECNIANKNICVIQYGMRISGSDLHLFRVFDSVIRNEGISSAQLELSLSQPTISNHLSALEDRIGFKLCHRGRGGFSLTEKGKIVYQIVQEIIVLMDMQAEKLVELRGALTGKVRVGVVDCLSSDENCKLPQVIAAASIQAPMIEIVLSVCTPSNIIAGLGRNELDLGIGGFDIHVNGLDYAFLYEEQNRLYCGAASPLFNLPDDEITPKDCYGSAWVHRAYWNQQRRRQLNLYPNEADRLIFSIEAQILHILSGAYIGLLPCHFARSFEVQDRLRALPVHEDDYNAKIELVSRSRSPQRNIEFVKGLILEAFHKHL